MSEYIQIVTTTERREDADRIAQALVEARLAACVQVVGPITSTYRWRGKIETAQEWQCWAKSRRELYDEVEQAIRRFIPTKSRRLSPCPSWPAAPTIWRWLDEVTRMTKLE